MRADLLILIQKTLETRGLRHAQAAKPIGAMDLRISDLVPGRLGLFSVDSLIDMLAGLRVRVRLVVVPPKKRARVA